MSFDNEHWTFKVSGPEGLLDLHQGGSYDAAVTSHAVGLVAIGLFVPTDFQFLNKTQNFVLNSVTLHKIPYLYIRHFEKKSTRRDL